MKSYPIREPFNDLEYKNMQNSYKRLIQKRYGIDTSFDDDTPASLQDIYTPLSLAKKEYSDDKRYSIEDAILKDQFLAITGVAGSGKSTITKFLSVATADDGVNDTIKKVGKRLVLPFILRELEFDKINSLDELFSQWIGHLNTALQKENKEPFTKEFFEFYIKNGWAILIFDGFDEIGAQKNKNLIKWLNELIDTYQLRSQKDIRTNIIITGRPTGFLDKVDYSTFKKYYLQPYDQEQIKLYANKYFSIKYSHLPEKIEEKSKSFLERLDKFDDLKQLKSRPIYLMMLAHISENKGELPKTRTLAYQQMIESYLHILDKQKELYEKQQNIELPQWDMYDKTVMLEELAYKIHTKADKEFDNVVVWEQDISQLQIQVSKEEVLKYFEEIVKDSRLRSIDQSQDAKEILDYYLARTGLLVEPSEGHIQFSHLSFQEYLTASRIYRKQPKRKAEDYLKEELFDKLDRTGWSEIALLFYGIDSLKQGQGQSEQLQFLIDETKPSHLEFMVKLMILTENQFAQDEKDRWFKSIIYIMLTQKNDDIVEYRGLNSYIPRLLLEEQCEHEYNIIEEFIQKFYKAYIEHHNMPKDIKKELLRVAEDDDADLANRLKNKASKDISIENILYIMHRYKNIRNKLKEGDLPNLLKDSQTATILDKYIPYNSDIKTSISNAVLNKFSLKQLVLLNGNYPLIYSPLYTDNKLYNEIIRLQLVIQRYSYFIINNNTAMDMAMDMARARATDMARAKAMAMDMATDTDMDMDMDTDMARARAIDMARAIDIDMDMARDMARDMAMAMARARAMARDMGMDMARTNKESIKKLGYRAWQFSLFASSLLYAQHKGVDTTYSKEDFTKLYKQLSTKPVKYFENQGITINNKQKKEIEELFKSSYLIKIMKYTVEDNTYSEFDEEKAIIDFHNEIKKFIKKE